MNNFDKDWNILLTTKSVVTASENMLSKLYIKFDTITSNTMIHLIKTKNYS